MSYKSVVAIRSISRVHAENSWAWTEANHKLLVKELDKLFEYMQKEHRKKLEKQLAKADTPAAPKEG